MLSTILHLSHTCSPLTMSGAGALDGGPGVNVPILKNVVVLNLLNPHQLFKRNTHDDMDRNLCGMSLRTLIVKGTCNRPTEACGKI